jgi:hypothetical protein
VRPRSSSSACSRQCRGALLNAGRDTQCAQQAEAIRRGHPAAHGLPSLNHVDIGADEIACLKALLALPSAAPRPQRSAHQHMSDEQRVTVRVGAVVASLSLATDLGTGVPEERALRACVLAVRLGQLVGLDDRALADTYYMPQLVMLGCTADSPAGALVYGDEVAISPKIGPLMFGAPVTCWAGSSATLLPTSRPYVEPHLWLDCWRTPLAAG